MPPVARKPQQIYINRDIDFIIESHIKEKSSKLLFVHGQGGMGKSTLLKKFLSYDAKEIPTVLINLQDRNINNFVDILLDEDITSVKHCPSFEKIRTILLKEPKLLNAIIKSDTDVVESQIEEYDKEWGEYAKIAIDGFKFGAKFLKNADEKKKKEFLNNPEFVLLSALTEDFEEYGLFMVDTFEKIKANDIKSKINFTDSGELSMRLKEKHYRLKDYIEGLVYLLVGSSTFIIAGRNSQDELNMEVPLDYCDELSLENFSISNIKELFSIHVKRDNKLSMPSDKQIEQIAELTNGNPLIVGLFPKVAKEYDSWDELDYEEMQRRIKTDDEFGLLYYMTDRVLSHLDESKKVWRLVIPRVLNAEIEKLLFKDEKILKELIEVGLATKGIGKDSGRYYLHDDVHRAIVAYYERAFKNGFSSWHDAEVVAEIHRELMGFYEKYTELYEVNSAFEGCYHKMMLREGFENDFQIERESFISFILGSLNLSSSKKHTICQDWKSIEDSEIIKYIQDLKNEKDKTYISSKLFDELSKALAYGIIDNLEDIEYLIKLSKDEFQKDWSIFYTLGNAYAKKEEYDNSIEAYKKAVEINPKKDIAYNNMGYVYRYNGEYDKAIEASLKAIKINPNYYHAYNNIGITYDKKGEYNKAIEAYQKAVEINLNFYNAYFNMGITYCKKREFDKAIEFLKKAIDIKPKKDEAYYIIGIIYPVLEEYDKAIAAYKKAVEINPKNDDAYYNMGIAYGNKEEYDKAIEAYQKAVEINPKKDDAYYNMGNAYYEKEEYDNAIKAYQKAVEINPKKDETYNNMGIAYRKKEEYDKAIEAYQKALEINPKNDGAYNGMGVAYSWLGKFDEVIKSYTKALNINPNNSSAYTNLFELQLTKNQSFDQALEKKYIELFQNKKESFIHYEMLKILQDISHKKEVNLEQWKQKYEGVSMGGWSFDELETWIDGVEDRDLKVRLREALGVFKVS